jgi:hypothetical protein
MFKNAIYCRYKILHYENILNLYINKGRLDLKKDKTQTTFYGVFNSYFCIIKSII